MLNYAELDLDTDLNDHYRAQNAPKKSPRTVSEPCCFMCRAYRIKKQRSQFLNQKLNWYLCILPVNELQKRMWSMASLFPLKTRLNTVLFPKLPSQRVSSPSHKGLKFNMLLKATWAHQSIFLTPLNLASRLKEILVCARESSQSYRGIY